MQCGFGKRRNCEANYFFVPDAEANLLYQLPCSKTLIEKKFLNGEEIQASLSCPDFFQDHLLEI